MAHQAQDLGNTCPWEPALIGLGGSLGCLKGDAKRSMAFSVSWRKGVAAGSGRGSAILEIQSAKLLWDAVVQ